MFINYQKSFFRFTKTINFFISSIIKKYSVKLSNNIMIVKF